MNKELIQEARELYNTAHNWLLKLKDYVSATAHIEVSTAVERIPALCDENERLQTDNDKLLEHVSMCEETNEKLICQLEQAESNYTFLMERLQEAQHKAATVEIVHCKDCKHLDIRGLRNGYCKRRMAGTVAPYDYCSQGERSV